MQRIRFTFFFILLSALSAPAFGKSTTQLDNGDFLTVIDAAAGGAFATGPHDFTYFNFEHQDVVALTDAEAMESAEWHIAFKRSDIRLNGGISGPGNVRSFDLNGAEEIVAEDAFDAITATDIPTAYAFIADGPAYAIGEWYSFDLASHRIEVPSHAYELCTADGQFAKFVIDAIEGASHTDAGRITFRWVVADGTDMTGAARSATVDVSEGEEVYFNLSSGEQVTPTDPATSLDWDLHFSGYVIRLNGGISGPGQGGAFPAYQTDQIFENIAEAMGFGYFADKPSSAFSSGTGEWYSYDSTTHVLSTRNHVYLIDTGEGYYKMQFLNYYREVEGSPVSGFITFRWRPLTDEPETAIQSSSWGQLKASVWGSN